MTKEFVPMAISQVKRLRLSKVVYVPSGNFYWRNHKKYTPKELFQEFLKTKQ